MNAKGFDFENPVEIMEEIASLTPSYGGISYDRIENVGLQWPCPTKEHKGTPILHTEQFSRGKGKFTPLEYKPPAELPDAEYPLLLTTDRSLYHYHTGSMTRKVDGLNVLRANELVEIMVSQGCDFVCSDDVFDKVAEIARASGRAPGDCIKCANDILKADRPSPFATLELLEVE